jgi:Predicted metal-dependent phosphoesterases (PHP family)
MDTPGLFHPYNDLAAGGQWLRGNLHTHTTRSDGARDVQAVIDDYAARGYDFLALSDHDIFTSAADYAAWDSRGMLLIPGNEVTRNGPHLLHVGAERYVEPTTDRQAVIDDITRGGGGGFVVVNHPDWQEGYDHCPLEKLRAWDGYAGVEIYNGVISRLYGSPYALRKWEALLTDGRRGVWGFAHDDSHAAQDVALGWNVVWVKERTAAAVVEALRTGRFYASTGVTITAIEVDGRRVRIATENAERIVAYTRWGLRAATADGPEMTLEVPETLPYVRFECWGRGERFAWTQPFWTRP